MSLRIRNKKPINYEPLLESLQKNSTLQKLTLRHLGLGKKMSQNVLTSSLILYNESIKKLDLRGNSLTNLRVMTNNLVQNLNSKIQRLYLSENDFEVYDVKEML